MEFPYPPFCLIQVMGRGIAMKERQSEEDEKFCQLLLKGDNIQKSKRKCYYYYYFFLQNSEKQYKTKGRKTNSSDFRKMVINSG